MPKIHLLVFDNQDEVCAYVRDNNPELFTIVLRQCQSDWHRLNRDLSSLRHIVTEFNKDGYVLALKGYPTVVDYYVDSVNGIKN